MCTAVLAVLLGLVGLPRYLAREQFCRHSTEGFRDPSSSEASRSFRLHFWIATWCAGGHVARLSGDGGAVDCASETFAAATVTNAAMIGTAKRKGNSFRLYGVC
jgi:hypothetical protein